MGNITLSMPEDIHARMRAFPEMKWSEVARRAIIEKIETLEKIERIANKSKLTQQDVDDISRKVKTSANRRFMNEHHNRQ